MEEAIFERLARWLEEVGLPGPLEPETMPASVPVTALTLTQSRDIAVREDVLGQRWVRTRFIYSLRFRLPMEVGRTDAELENRRCLDETVARLRRESMLGLAPVFGEEDRLTVSYPRLESIREGTGVYSSVLTLETTFAYEERMKKNGTESD